MTLVINEPVLLAFLEARLRPHAEAGGAFLVEAMSHPGEGQHWPDNPNPSSLPGAYPAVQTEKLIQSIDVRKAKRLTFAIGSFADQSAEGHQHAVELEGTPPEAGGRQFLEKAMHDPAFQQAVLTAEGQ